jgi:hypothetical protein
MGTKCSPGVMYPVDYSDALGVAVGFEQAAFAVAVAAMAFGRVMRG